MFELFKLIKVSGSDFPFVTNFVISFLTNLCFENFTKMHLVRQKFVCIHKNTF